jgi:hypothetical protein
LLKEATFEEISGMGREESVPREILAPNVALPGFLDRWRQKAKRPAWAGRSNLTERFFLEARSRVELD